MCPPELTDDQLLGAYAVPASLLHAHLLDLTLHGERTMDLECPADAYAPMLSLFRLAARYAPSPSRELDSWGANSQELRLAHRVWEAVPCQSWSFSGPRWEMRLWAEKAERSIHALSKGVPTRHLISDELEFIRVELLPMLETISDLPSNETQF